MVPFFFTSRENVIRQKDQLTKWRGVCFILEQQAMGIFATRIAVPGSGGGRRTDDHVAKLFLSITNKVAESARMFVPGKTFRPGLIFIGKARNLPRAQCYKTFSFRNLRIFLIS